MGSIRTKLVLIMMLLILALMTASHEGLLRRTAGRPAESAAC